MSSGDGSLQISFPTMRLEIEEVERLLRHLDQLWAEVVQLAEYLAADGHPVPRNQVTRFAILRAGLTPPHEISLLDTDPPARPEVWQLYRRILAAPSTAPTWLPERVGSIQHEWDVAQRARHDAALAAAIAPLTSQRRPAGGSPPGDGLGALPRLMRRIGLQAGQLDTIAGAATIRGPAGLSRS